MRLKHRDHPAIVPSHKTARPSLGAGPDHDRLAVAETVTVLLHAVDRRDWDTIRNALADTVDVDYTSLSGGEPGSPTAEGLIGTWRELLPGFDSTQHLTGPILTKIKGGTAIATCAVTATHALGEARWVVGGHYEMRLTHRAVGWRIAGIRLRTAFVDGDRSLPDKARARARLSALTDAKTT